MDSRIIFALVAALALGGFFADWLFNGNHEEKRAEAAKPLSGPMRGIDDVDQKPVDAERAKRAKQKPTVDVELVDESTISDD